MTAAAAQLAFALEESPARPEPVARPNPGRHLCAACQARPARFRYRGVVKADRMHTLCFQCYRSALDRARTVSLRLLRASLPGDPGDGPGPAAAVVARPGLFARQITEAAGERDAALSLRRRRAQIAARHALETPVD